MKIGLVDVDGHHFPNLALMKLSAWHKAHGDSVEWHEPLEPEQYDKVYMSKVFTFSPDYPWAINAKEIVRGGQDTDCIKTSQQKWNTHSPIIRYIRNIRLRSGLSQGDVFGNALGALSRARRDGYAKQTHGRT